MAGSGSSSISTQIFNTIQGQEAAFPLPVARKTFTVGTFDASTGKFGYAVPTYMEKFTGPPDGGGPPKPRISIGGQLNAQNVIDVVLRFNVTHRQGAFTATVAGAPAVSTTTANSVDVQIGAATNASFSLSSNGKTFESELPLEINHRLIGAGVFSIPALPVSIVYAPPVDQSQKNVSKWAVTNTTGNTTTFTFTSANSTTQPVTPQFNTVNDFVSVLKGIATAIGLISAAGLAGGQSGAQSGGGQSGGGQSGGGQSGGGKSGGDPTAKLIAGALDIIAGALGSSSATETQSVTATSQQSLTLTASNQQTITTNAANGGPGSGDVIVYLKNPKLAWVVDGAGPLRVTVFGHDGIGLTSVGFMKSGGQTDLDAATTNALLALDPFVAGGPSVTLPAGRFAYLDTIDLNGSEINIAETHTVSKTESQQTTNTTQHVENDKAGVLSFIDIGVTNDGSTQTSITQTSATQTQNTNTIANTIDLLAKAAERYSVEIYCDVVFGTFAYRQVATSPTPVVTGTAVGSDGKPAANQIVTLMNNNRKYTTRANANGQYAFSASTIKPGPSVLTLGKLTQAFELSAAAAVVNLKG